MSEVKRYEINGTFEVPETGQKLVNPKMVMESDFDRVTAERDAAMGREAALREKLSTANGCLNEWRRSTLGRTLLENAALQQRLTAADERADVLEGLVGEVLDAVGREPLDLDAVLRLRARMRAALNPAEGGGDEAI